MKQNKLFPSAVLKPVMWFGVAVAAFFLFTYGLTQLRQGQNDTAYNQLEQSLRRAAVACYSCEGVYPPDLDYLVEHYGIQIEEDRYAVFYEVFAENLMPDITVVEKQS